MNLKLIAALVPAAALLIGIPTTSAQSRLGVVGSMGSKLETFASTSPLR